MTIHDEIVLQLIIKKDENGRTPLRVLCGLTDTDPARFRIENEQPVAYSESLGLESFRPDIVVFFKEPHMASTNPVSNPPIAGYAIEIENDIQWNFAQSLQQIKKYHQGYYPIAIIPKIYSRYKTLYELEGITVWLWSAERIWECMRCGEIITSSRTAKPKCSNNRCSGQELRLMGIQNFTLESDEETIEIL